MPELLLNPYPNPYLQAIADSELAVTPQELESMHPLTALGVETVQTASSAVVDIFRGVDPRMMATVGMCCPDASRQPDGRYSTIVMAESLKELQQLPIIRDNVLIVLRDTITKPRTAGGHRGMDQTDPILAHDLMTQVSNMGVPQASEVMTPAQMARYGSRLSHIWIGARDVSSTILRHTVAAYPHLPTLVKNGETGSLEPALNAIETIGSSHKKVEVIRPDGRLAILPVAPGNRNTALLFRGGSDYMDEDSYEKGLQEAAASGIPYEVDTSHGGAVAHGGKSAEGQMATLDHVIDLMKRGALSRNPAGIMIEAYLLAGKDGSGETAGMSTMDPCVSISQLGRMLTRMAEVHATLQRS